MNVVPTLETRTSAAPRRRSLSVALLTPTMEFGGIERVRMTLARGLVARGHRVEIVFGSGGALAAAAPSGVSLHELRAKRMREIILPLARYLRSTQPDVLVAPMAHTAAAAVLARGVARVATRIVASEHTVIAARWSEMRPAMRRFLPLLYRAAYARVDRVICVSEAIRASLEALTRLPREQFVAIANPTDLHLVREMARVMTPHPWLADRDLPVIVTMGRMVDVKAQDVLLKAFAKLAAVTPVRLVLVGDGPLRGRLENLASELGVADRVLFPGFDTNPYRWIARASCFASASRVEGFGNALVEALALGIPVVATDCPGGHREILDGGRIGALVPVNDAASLTKAMREALTSPPPAEFLRAAAEAYGEAPIDAYEETLLAVVSGG